MELVAGHVEVGEVVVLLLDLDVAVGEVLVLFLDLAEALLDPAVPLAELLDLRAEALDLLGGGLAVLGLERGKAVAQALVLPKQLLGELLAFIE